MDWNAELYDNKHNFVAEYGKGLLEFVPLNKEQAILDLGCGTGTLTGSLLPLARRVVGVDNSKTMIDKAKEQNSDMEFFVCDALKLPFEHEFDVVFSNAVFHWISDHNLLLDNIHRALKPKGMLICEFGGEGNISTVENAFSEACSEYGIVYIPKFNFPSVKIFSDCLSANGFTIERIYDYDRPTALKNGEKGLENWLRQFFALSLDTMPKEIGNAVIRRVEETTKAKLWNGNEWIVDYRRLRAIAQVK